MTLEESRNDLFYRVVARASTQTLVNDREVLESDEFMTMLLEYSIAVETISMKSRVMSAEEIQPDIELASKHKAIFNKYIQPVIAKRRDRSKAVDNATGLSDFLQFMLDDETISKDSDEDVTTRLSMIVFAAYMTTTMTTKNLLLDIACRPHVQEQLAEERLKVLGEDRCKLGAANANITADDIKKMVLLESALRESMRSMPAALGPSVRIAKNDASIDHPTNGKSYHIPKGTLVMTCGVTSHQNDAVYENSSTYDHERFLTERPDSSKFFFFGGGKHACPGRFFAIAEIKSIVSALLMDYTFVSEKESNFKYNNARAYRETVDVIITKRIHT